MPLFEWHSGKGALQSMKQQGVNVRKVAVIGCGYVGAASAFALMQSGLFAEMVLLDANED